MCNMPESSVTCSSCGQKHTVAIYPSINVSSNPELKEKVVDGEVFVTECPHCGHRDLLKYNMLYHDPEGKLILCLSDTEFHSDGMEGYTCRLVEDAGSLIEKIKIFDAGLDDITMEICKLVTCQELGKEVELRFFKMEGADNELIFTYPENGGMQMVSVGFNVYEDCSGIVKRNPRMEEGASGLARVDRQWLSAYIG